MDSTEEFAALEEEWTDLYSASVRATPFQSWGWLFSWWETYGEGLRLSIATFRTSEGDLVGLLPLAVESGGLRRLLFLGTGMTEYHDMLVREEWRDEVCRAARDALKNCIKGWRVADLQQLRPGSEFWGVVALWQGLSHRMWNSDYLELDADSWDELLSTIGKKRRETARRTIRKVAREGVERRFASGDDLDDSTMHWVELHRDYWRQRDINPEHLTPRFEVFMRCIVQRMTDGGQGVLVEFTKDDEVVAADFVMIGHDFVTGFLEGSNEYATKQFELNTLYMHSWMDISGERKVGCVSLMQGDEPYKLKWNPDRLSNDRVILGRSPIAYRTYLAYRRSRTGLSRHLNASEEQEGTRLTRFYRSLYGKIRKRL